ncbi:MAG: toll/interleukin-1 receptor domain-containing protein [Anaerolineae bacterium]|nr:toll/interleukin-1 receptor domain-containing protein [Anaerolineae bacterium]
MAQLFISYSKQDIEFARHLRALLQTAGLEVWMDERLVPSTQWWRMLERQIKASVALIVIMSPSSAESRWVEREILVAENNNLPIFPVLLAGEGWSRLADIQYEDFTAGLNAVLPPRFVDALKAVISGKPVARDATQPIKLRNSATESRLLEAAMPAETRSGSDTEMWAKISLPDSPGLRAELPALVPTGDVIQKGDARTTSFPFRFPTDPRTGERLPVQVTLKASSADFSIRSPGGDDVEVVELPPDTDSRTVIFTLFYKPGGRLTGRARIFLDLIYERKVIAQISVSTHLVEEVTRLKEGASPWAIWTVPVGSTTASAGGYAAPGGVMERAELDANPLANAESGGAPAAFEDELYGGEDDSMETAEGDETSWQGAFPAQPLSPIPPEVQQEALKGVSGGASAAKPVPAPITPQPAAKRRSASFRLPAAASAIAGLALVFVVVMLALNNSAGPPLATSAPTDDPSIAMALQTEAAVTATADAEATLTQTFLEQSTEVFPEVTWTAGAEATRLAQSLTAEPVNPGETGGRHGIAAAKLANCGDSVGASRLSNLLDELNISHALLSGDMVEGTVEVLGDPSGAALLFYGACQGDGTVLLTAELLAPPPLHGILHPQRVEIGAPVEMLLDTESPVGRYLRAVSLYMAGQFDLDLLNVLVAAEEALPTVVDNTAGWMALNVMIGTAHLFYEDGYDNAVSRYEVLQAGSGIAVDSLVAARNNLGFLNLNRAFTLEAADSPEFEENTASASQVLGEAYDLADDPPTQHLTILINQAWVWTFVQSRIDAAMAQEAIAICQQAQSFFSLDSEPIACEVAARITILEGSGRLCESSDELSELLARLDEALTFDAGEPYGHFWRGVILDHQASCSSEASERELVQAAADAAFQRFLDLIAGEPAHLAVDRANIAEALDRVAG